MSDSASGEATATMLRFVADFMRQTFSVIGIRGVFVAMFLSYAISLTISYPRIKDAPIVGYRNRFEPTILLRLRHLTSARKIMHEGYSKYKKSMFVMRRMDSDITIISNDYLAELKDLPLSKLNSTRVQVQNLTANYTWLSLIAESDQHVRVLQNHLTPNLSTFLRRAEKEANFSFETDVPHPKDWTEVDIHAVVRTMVTRMSSIVFLGEPICRDERWLQICGEYSLNVFGTAFTLRLVPPLARPVVARLLPQRWRLRRNILDAEAIVLPVIADYEIRRNLRMNDPTTKDEPSTLLDWMIKTAKGKEALPKDLAARQLNLTLASIHTTTLAICNAIFDICAFPEFLSPLREEIVEVCGGRVNNMSKQDLTKLQKLDSFLAESQRFNAVLNVASQRQALEPITLKDGRVIPKGARIAFPHNAIVMDPEVNPNPDSFDAFRSYRKRQIEGESTKHSMVQTSKDNLTFGYGRAACPGRFFAVNEMKLAVGKFLMDYDFKFPEGKTRPKNMDIDEMVFPDPREKIMLRMRKDMS